jgi:hypothetical protein
MIQLYLNDIDLKRMKLKYKKIEFWLKLIKRGQKYEMKQKEKKLKYLLCYGIILLLYSLTSISIQILSEYFMITFSSNQRELVYTYIYFYISYYFIKFSILNQ